MSWKQYWPLTSWATHTGSNTAEQRVRTPLKYGCHPHSDHCISHAVLVAFQTSKAQLSHCKRACPHGSRPPPALLCAHASESFHCFSFCPDHWACDWVGAFVSVPCPFFGAEVKSTAGISPWTRGSLELSILDGFQILVTHLERRMHALLMVALGWFSFWGPSCSMNLEMVYCSKVQRWSLQPYSKNKSNK